MVFCTDVGMSAPPVQTRMPRKLVTYLHERDAATIVRGVQRLQHVRQSAGAYTSIRTDRRKHTGRGRFAAGVCPARGGVAGGVRAIGGGGRSGVSRFVGGLEAGEGEVGSELGVGLGDGSR